MGASVPGENKVVQNVGSGIRGPRSVSRLCHPQSVWLSASPSDPCLGFLICRTGKVPWYPAPRLMTRMTGDRCLLHRQGSTLLLLSSPWNIQWNMLGDRLVYHCGLFFFFFQFLFLFKPLGGSVLTLQTWGDSWHLGHCLPCAFFPLSVDNRINVLLTFSKYQEQEENVCLF